MIFSVVVLPHPLGPMMLVSSPRGTSKLTPPSALVAAELLGEVEDADGGGAVGRRRSGLGGGAGALGHSGLISGRKSRCSARCSSVMLMLATRMIDRIEANIRG